MATTITRDDLLPTPEEKAAFERLQAMSDAERASADVITQELARAYTDKGGFIAEFDALSPADQQAQLDRMTRLQRRMDSEASVPPIG